MMPAQQSVLGPPVKSIVLHLWRLGTVSEQTRIDVRFRVLPSEP